MCGDEDVDGWLVQRGAAGTKVVLKEVMVFSLSSDVRERLL